VKGGWRKLQGEELQFLLSTKYFQDNQIKEDEMAWACNTHRGNGKCL
jgi:hypothetical protein